MPSDETDLGTQAYTLSSRRLQIGNVAKRSRVGPPPNGAHGVTFCKFLGPDGGMDRGRQTRRHPWDPSPHGIGRSAGGLSNASEVVAKVTSEALQS